MTVGDVRPTGRPLPLSPEADCEVGQAGVALMERFASMWLTLRARGVPSLRLITIGEVTVCFSPEHGDRERKPHRPTRSRCAAPTPRPQRPERAGAQTPLRRRHRGGAGSRRRRQERRARERLALRVQPLIRRFIAARRLRARLQDVNVDEARAQDGAADCAPAEPEPHRNSHQPPPRRSGRLSKRNQEVTGRAPVGADHGPQQAPPKSRLAINTNSPSRGRFLWRKSVVDPGDGSQGRGSARRRR